MRSGNAPAVQNRSTTEAMTTTYPAASPKAEFRNLDSPRNSSHTISRYETNRKKPFGCRNNVVMPARNPAAKKRIGLAFSNDRSSTANDSKAKTVLSPWWLTVGQVGPSKVPNNTTAETVSNPACHGERGHVRLVDQGSA